MQEALYQSFENYINNELPLVERKVLESQLKNDADLKKKFDLYKETSVHLAQKFSVDTQDFKENLKNIANENKPKKKSKVIAFKPWHFMVAASIALFFGLLYMNQPIAKYDDYNQHENMNMIERGDVIKSLKLAQDAFNSKNYKEAITHFEVVLKEYPRPEIKYFYAISLIEDNRFADSETILKELSTGKTTFKNNATWYLALSKLKQQKPEECKAILKTIPTDFEDYDQVSKLLKEVK
jgi:predicted Zn-dependent protease